MKARKTQLAFLQPLWTQHTLAKFNKVISFLLLTLLHGIQYALVIIGTSNAWMNMNFNQIMQTRNICKWENSFFFHKLWVNQPFIWKNKDPSLKTWTHKNYLHVQILVEVREILPETEKKRQHVVCSYATGTSLIFPRTVYFSSSRKVWVFLLHSSLKLQTCLRCLFFLPRSLEEEVI